MNSHSHNHKHKERHTFLYSEIETKFCAQVILALVIIGGQLYYVVEDPAGIKGILSSCVVSF